MKNYTRFGLRRSKNYTRYECKNYDQSRFYLGYMNAPYQYTGHVVQGENTLVTSGEHGKLHSKRVETTRITLEMSGEDLSLPSASASQVPPSTESAYPNL